MSPEKARGILLGMADELQIDFDGSDRGTALWMAIEALKTMKAQKQKEEGSEARDDSRWTPCSGRMPEKEDYEPYSVVLCKNTSGKTRLGWYDEDLRRWVNIRGGEIRDVVEWAPAITLVNRKTEKKKEQEKARDPLWEALQTMCSMKQGTLEMLFGCGDIGGIIKKTKPWELVEAVRRYQNIRIGDEVKVAGRRGRCVVVDTAGCHSEKYLVSNMFDWGKWYGREYITPTGRYFPEVKEIIAAMRARPDEEEKMISADEPEDRITCQDKPESKENAEHIYLGVKDGYCSVLRSRYSFEELVRKAENGTLTSECFTSCTGTNWNGVDEIGRTLKLARLRHTGAIFNTQDPLRFYGKDRDMWNEVESITPPIPFKGMDEAC